MEKTKQLPVCEHVLLSIVQSASKCQREIALHFFNRHMRVMTSELERRLMSEKRFHSFVWSKVELNSAVLLAKHFYTIYTLFRYSIGINRTAGLSKTS